MNSAALFPRAFFEIFLVIMRSCILAKPFSRNSSSGFTVRMNAFTGNGAQVSVSDTNPAVPRKFYRGYIRSN